MSDPTTHTQRTERFDLKALYETSQLLSASLDLKFVLNSLLLTAMSKLLVTRGAVLLYDPVEGAYRTQAAKGIPKLTYGDLVKMPQISSDHLLYDDQVPEQMAEHRMVLVLPVAFGKRGIGLVALGQKATRKPFSERELEFIRSLVNMSSTAVHNSLMVEELKQANRDLDSKIQELNTLFDLSQEFNATIDRSRVVKLLSFALMGQMLISKHLFVLRRKQRSNVENEHDVDFQIIAKKGIKESAINPALFHELCNIRTLLILQDEIPEKWIDLADLGLVLVLPLQQQGETCGLLCLGPKMTGQVYQPSDIEFLSALGNLALVSIQNSYLVEEQIEKERMEKEMRLARQIQERLLPQELPSAPGVDIAALALPSRFVGGDYYGVSKLDESRLLMAIADVTGKGVPAALLMANIQASLHVMLPLNLPIEEMTVHINRVICDNTSYDKFITFFQCIYFTESSTLQYVNAGHNPPMLVRKNGAIEWLDKGGLLLGVMKGLPYERGEVQIADGDVLAMFTDGVTEAMSPENEEYGEDRLEACLTANRQRTAKEILDVIRQEIRNFTGDTDLLSDDLTMIVMKVMTKSEV